MPINSNILKKYLNPVFIETGSGMGDGIQAAFDAGFRYIASIDSSQDAFNHCVDRFKNYVNVYLSIVDTKEQLCNLIKVFSPQNNITFWLDAHNENDYPVLAELDQIAQHNIKTHTILIDDLRMFPTDKNGLTIEQIKAKILSINPDYKFSYENGHVENDILVAKI